MMSSINVEQSKTVVNSESANSNTCIVCYKNVEYYSIGMCEHPVCYECSTRMRVLCQQNECPICRQDLPKVVFTKEIKPFRFLKKGNLLDTRYNIYFDNREIMEKFNMLLAHTCNICKDEMFGSFNNLKEHMRKKHDLFYCDLCVDNLKIFSYERRCYTKVELSRHRRKGDLDDKSHKGHPLCEFCEQRYMDNDELFRHLRRDHLFCHFCDADGLHQYYLSYDYLRDHFRQEHFLCEEGNCAVEQFTSVFRTNIDLKAHKASVHGKHLGKAAAKQARTLELEFTLAPRGDLRNRRGLPGSARNFDGNANYARNQQQPEPAPTFEEPTFIRQASVDVQSTEEFPTLGNSASNVTPTVVNQPKRGNFRIRSVLRPGNYDENFPALGPEAAAASNGVSKTLNLSVSSSNKWSKQPNAKPNLSIHVNHRPNGTVTTRLSGPNLRINPSTSRDADFPALGRSGVESLGAASSSSSPSTGTQSWTKITCVKPAAISRSKKVAPPPLAASPPPIRSGDDFPSLSKSTKNSPGPVQNTTSFWTQSSDSNAASITADATKGKAKKKKMKQPTSSSARSNVTNSSAKTKQSSPLKSESAKKVQPKAKSSPEPNIVESVAPANPQRKRAELKIESLNTTNNNPSVEAKTPTSNLEDFPALGRHSRPPGLPSPPPGFAAPPSAPPPGFFNRMNGLTFTNSSGESYAIVPEEPEYRTPVDFRRQNQNLIDEFATRCGSESSERFAEFQFWTGLFLNGDCGPDEYYKLCQTLMGGAEHFEQIFPKILLLLPDTYNQEQLFEVHKRETGRFKSLEMCTICGQDLQSSSLQEYLTCRSTHEHDFPALCRASKNTGSITSSRK